MPHVVIAARKVEINAPVSLVWEILFDLARYPEWNPYTVRIDADLSKLGNPVGLHVQMNPKKRLLQVERLRICEPEKQLSWGMQILHPWILCAQRYQTLEKLGTEKCSYYTEDVFDGILVGIMMKMYGADVERGFNAISEALKLRAEKMWIEGQAAS